MGFDELMLIPIKGKRMFPSLKHPDLTLCLPSLLFGWCWGFFPQVKAIKA
jgi:hypothetical protein